MGGAAVLTVSSYHVCYMKKEWQRHWSNNEDISYTLTLLCSLLSSSPTNSIG